MQNWYASYAKCLKHVSPRVQDSNSQAHSWPPTIPALVQTHSHNSPNFQIHPAFHPWSPSSVSYFFTIPIKWEAEAYLTLSQMPRNHRPSSSLKKVNKSVAPYLPSHNTYLCIVIRNFTISLTNFNNKTSLEEQLPDSQHFMAFQNQPLKESTLANVYPNNHEFPQTHKEELPPFIVDTFAKNLQAVGIPTPRFQWQHPSTNPWNKLLISMLAKHWLLARQHGAFSKVPIEDKFCEPDFVEAIISRWYDGKKGSHGKVSQSSTLKVKLRKKVSKINFFFRHTMSIWFYYFHFASDVSFTKTDWLPRRFLLEKKLPKNCFQRLNVALTLRKMKMIIIFHIAFLGETHNILASSIC